MCGVFKMLVDQDKRDRPYPSVIRAIRLLKAGGLNKIIEIGCSRGPLNHPIEEYFHPCCNDGHSTAIFAANDLEVTSIDVSQESVRCAREILSKMASKPYQVLCTDGLEYLKNRIEPIELLFLDAWDVGTTNSSEFHLEAYNIAKKLMSSGSMVLIDDTDVDFDGTNLIMAGDIPSGKGKLLFPQALKDGFEEVFRGRQTLLRKK